MWVEWRLEDCGDHVRVTIDHELNYAVPILGPLFAQHIVGNLFVHAVAGTTLQCIKSKVEAEEAAYLVEPIRRNCYGEFVSEKLEIRP